MAASQDQQPAAGSSSGDEHGNPTSTPSSDSTTDSKKEKSPKRYLALLYQVGYLVNGAMAIGAMKWQDNIVLDGEPFRQVMIQIAIAFASMAAMLIPYYVPIWRRQRRGEELIEGVHVPKAGMCVARVAMPAVLYWSALLLTGWSLVYTTASVMQMIRATVIIFTALLSRVLLKRRFQWFQLCGMATVILGVLTVSYASVREDDSATGSNPLAGEAMVLFAQLLLAIRAVQEERIYKEYAAHELYMCGWEGLIGMCLSIGLSAVAYLVPATHPVLGDPAQFFVGLRQDSAVVWSSVMLFAAQGLLQTFAQGIVKLISATMKTLLSPMRIIGVWIVGLAFLGERFLVVEFMGFLILVLGLFVFKDAIPLPAVCRGDAGEEPSQPTATATTAVPIDSNKRTPSSDMAADGDEDDDDADEGQEMLPRR